MATPADLEWWLTLAPTLQWAWATTYAKRALLDDGLERDQAVKDLKAFKRPPIWKPGKRPTDPIIVGDERRFLRSRSAWVKIRQRTF